VTRRDVGKHRDRPLPVAARDRLQGGPFLRVHDRLEGDQIARGRADPQPGDVLGTRTLLGQQAHAHVDPAAALVVFPDTNPAHRRVDRVGHVLDRHAEVGAARPVRHDAQFGHADLIVGVEVDHQAARGELPRDLVGEADQFFPV